jgi:hypothetical protein
MRKNRGQDGVRTSKHVAVPKAHRAIILFRKPAVADDIALTLGVLAPIEFDDKTMLRAQ